MTTEDKMQATPQAAQSTHLRSSSARPLSPRSSIYRWRAPMLASFAHRISGFVLLLFIPVYLYLLSALTASPEDFSRALDGMHSTAGRFMLWIVGAALIYHLANGLRFLLLDAGLSETREKMRASAWFSLVAGVIGASFLAVYLW